VLGTAGHIDHGKTTLVRALTGVDTDRLPEEKTRGITIELGFAPLDLAEGLRLSLVDVPGHEGLVRTMVAGATGIDLVLLVVAADEGVMPQTREHLAICELLGLSQGVVALTKTDLVTAELAELASEEVAALLSSGPLAGAPIVPVSAQTGAGLPELRAALHRAAERAAPRTPRSGPPRLAIDRAFAAKGFGAVVTGTLLGGALAVGAAVEIFPTRLRARVRGVQSHSEKRERGEPGSRCALNLQGVELAQLARGQIVSTPGALAPADKLDVWLDWLPAAPRTAGPVSVELLAATCERRARLAPIGADPLIPGAGGFARLHVGGEPLPVLPGDRFILRGFARSDASGATLGGGIVLDVAPPHRRRSDPQLLRELEELARREPERDLAVRLSRAALAGMPRERLRAQTGLSEADLDAGLAALVAQGRAVKAGSQLWLDAAAASATQQRLLAALAAWHAAEPIRPGIPARTLRGRLPENVAPEAFEHALARLAERGEVAVLGDLVSAAGFEARLSPADRIVVPPPDGRRRRLR
jgi:selenocysteine-specific elongation factor